MVIYELATSHGEPITRECLCKMCGKMYIHNKCRAKSSATYCEDCKKALQAQKAKEKIGDRDKYEVRFDKAIEELRKQIDDPEAYIKPIEIASTKKYRYGSIPEVMVAVELLRLKYKIIPQQRIGKYHVDFLIKDKKLVIEVDGKLFHRDKNSREAEIQLMLGLDWKIIHIPAELIRKNIGKLKECIDIYTR